MAEVSETKLPGIGVRYEFVTADGRRVGVVQHRDGRREIVIFDQRDPDACRELLRVEEDDSRTLAELLGGSRIVEEHGK